MIYNSHTHLCSPDSIVNLKPLQEIESGLVYSAGIHPWDAGIVSEDVWKWLEDALRRPEVVAVGECGLDKVCAVPLSVQKNVFVKQIELSECFSKPIVIHCVRAWQELLELYKRHEHKQIWIIHGFRGKPELARMLLQHGFVLSYGFHFNRESLLLTPPDRLLIESDECCFRGVVSKVSEVLNVSETELLALIRRNNLQIFG